MRCAPPRICTYAPCPTRQQHAASASDARLSPATLGLRVTVTVDDEADDRTGLAALLEHANLRRIDAVLTPAPQPLRPTPLDLLHVLDTIDKASVEVHTVTGGRIDTIDGYASRIAAMTASVRRPGRRITPPASSTARRAVS